MRDARDKAARLHRDISLANIVMVREHGSVVRRGYLIDWDASSPVDDSGQAVDRGPAVSNCTDVYATFCYSLRYCTRAHGCSWRPEC